MINFFLSQMKMDISLFTLRFTYVSAFQETKLNFQRNIHLVFIICHCLFRIIDLCIGCRLVKPSDLQTVSRAIHRKDQDNSVISCERQCQNLFALSVS